MRRRKVRPNEPLASDGYYPSLPDYGQAPEPAAWLELELRILLGEVALPRIESEACRATSVPPAPANPTGATLAAL